MASQETLTRVQELYVAYYGRPADKGGLQYWADRVEADGGIDAIINAFGDSAEYTDLAEGQDNSTLVNNIYQQAFGRDADDDGLAYYIGVLASGEKSLAEIATTIINAAGPGDKEVFEARAAAAAEYTESLDSDDDYDMAAAKEAVATAEPEADPSELTEALETLQSAEQAKSDFLQDEALANKLVKDELTDGDSTADAADVDDIKDAEIETALTTVQSAKETELSGARATTSDRVLQAQLEDAQEDVAAVEAKIAKVDGLTKAIADAEAATEASNAADVAKADAEADATAEVSAFTDKNTSAKEGIDSNAAVALQDKDGNTTADITAVTSVVDTGNSVELLTIKDGKVEVADGDLSAYTGLADLQSALQARLDATNAATQAQTAEDAALLKVDELDVSSAEAAAVAAFDKLASDYDSALDAYKADTSDAGAIAGLESAYSALNSHDNTAFPAITDSGTDGTADEIAAENADTQAAIAAEKLDLKTGGDTPLLDELTTEKGEQKAAQEAVDGRAELVAEVEALTALTDKLEASDDAIEAAEDQFTDAGQALPVVLDGGDDASATVQDDIFLLGSEDDTISGFGAVGEDKIYVGEGFTRVDLESDAAFVGEEQGDAATMEVFFQQKGANAVLTFEEKAFAGNGSTDGDLTEITLTGVNVEDLSIDNGIISIA